MRRKVFLAVDLGASSGRVLAGAFDGKTLALHEVHRFPHEAVSLNGRLYWQLFELWQNTLIGLRKAKQQFGNDIVSVGVDAWGVDFALIDRNGELLTTPVCYRDCRTAGLLDSAFALVRRNEIFAATGVQFMEINTLYQLLAVKRTGSPPLRAAGRLLMMPDLFHWMLTGQLTNELTVASTTQLFCARSQNWSEPLINKFDFPREIFGPIIPPGTILGPLLPAVAEVTGLHGVNVVIPASHDTASAVLAVPASENVATSHSAEQINRWCYLSSGTWSLFGLESAAPIINDQLARWNFTNESGVAGTTRVLKNITGLWVVQQCHRAWRTQGHNCDWDSLIGLAGQAKPFASIIDTDDARLAECGNMPEQIALLCRESHQPVPTNPGAFVRCALESLAIKYRCILEQLEHLAGAPMSCIHVVGGGVQNRLLCQMTADACQRPLLAGPVEATALGNVLMQAVAAGELANVAEARDVARLSSSPIEYQPRSDDGWLAAIESYSQRFEDRREG
jgi:rhamnulokinase